MARSNITIEGLKNIRDQVVFDLTNAAHIDNVFWQIQAIFENNPEINTGGIFQEWLVDTYVDSITVRLRRLADKGKKKISLWRLLEDWKRDIENIRPKSATKAEITAKQQELTNALNRVESYANSNIAHRAQKPQVTELTYLEVRKALISTFKIFNWCSYLLTKSVWATPVPLLEESWLAIFKVPWLKDSAPPPYKHLDKLLKEANDG